MLLCVYYCVLCYIILLYMDLWPENKVLIIIIWKDTKIVPVFKSGDQSDMTNYWPIAILSVLAKVFEALICPVIVLDNQYGFMRGKLTVTNLLKVLLMRVFR